MFPSFLQFFRYFPPSPPSDKAMTSIFGWGISDGRDIPGASFVVAAGLVALGGIAFEAMVDEE